MPVDLGETDGICYNWQETDVTNPVVTKVGYSKSLTLPGTKNNNNIFGQFWNLERYQRYDGSFNPSYRVPFVLYVNGDIFEKGYVKLEKVTREDSAVSYDVSLFGGLGSFLYNLSTDWNSGEKKTLGSLKYYQYPLADTGADNEDDTVLDLGFKICKETVDTAWNSLYIWGNKYRAINFAPCYNGLSEKMSCDKAIVNTNDISTFETSVRSGTTTYTPYNGWSLATLPRECNEWETKDLRSWAQRPVVSAKYIIDAISRKSNNSGKYDTGYDVELDPEFFKTDNPYYADAWMTLPLLTDLEYNTSEETSTQVSAAYKTYISASNGSNVTFVFELPSAVTSYGCSVTATFDLMVKVSGATEGTLYPGCVIGYPGGTKKANNAYAVQMCASSVYNTSGSSLAASDIKWLGYEEKNAYGAKILTPPTVSAAKSNGYTPLDENASVENDLGTFVRYSSGKYRWDKQLTLKCDLPVGAKYIKINIQKVSNINGAQYYLYPQTTLWNTQAFNYLSEFDYSAKDAIYNRTITVYTPEQNMFYSGREIRQEDILSTDYTPADWLMAYCKMFGLYIHKDPVEDKIYIDTRKTFYNRRSVTDISNQIDWSKPMEITPLAADSKYYAMQVELEDSGAATNYKDKYGKTYGMKLVDTGYEFNADTADAVDIPFKGAVQYRDYGSYYFRAVGNELQPYVFDGLSYLLYPSGNYSGTSITRTIDRLDIGSVCDAFDEDYKFYDVTDRPMFCDGERHPVDGANVMLFFLGETQNISSSDNYYLTDDLDVMARLNNGPCWIISAEDEDLASNQILIKRSTVPYFGRYYTPGAQRKIGYSMDFGNPRQLYTPSRYDSEKSTLYYNFYSTYFEDLYDVNTKILTCYLHSPKLLTGEDMRRFYWFDNSIWRLNRIIDENPASADSVKVEFIKIQDLDNITSKDVTDNVTGTITPSTMTIPASGGTFTVSVETSDGMGFAVEGITDDVDYSPSSSRIDGDITLTFPANDTQSDKTITLWVSWGDAGGSAQFTQLGGSTTPSLSVSPMVYNWTSASTTSTATITSNTSWTVSSKPSWVTVSPTSGSGTSTISLTPMVNLTTDTRTGGVVISSADLALTATIAVRQFAGNPRPAIYSVVFSPGCIKATTFNFGAGTTLLNAYITDEVSRWDFVDSGSSLLYCTGQNQTMEYEDSCYSYWNSVLTPRYAIPDSWLGLTKTFYLFVEAENFDGTIKRYVRSNAIQVEIPSELTGNITVTLPTDSGAATYLWYGPYQSS